MQQLAEKIKSAATDQGLALSDATDLAALFEISLYDVELTALTNGIKPLRYLRNNLTADQQLRLFQCKVSIIGCGGLGGYVIEFLSRMGFSHLRLVDPDSFEEHNLNRQRFSNIETIGINKAEAASKSIIQINPATSSTAIPAPFSVEDIIDADIVVDCLDNASSRLELFKLCSHHNHPLIHGAVKEWFGQAAVVKPENLLYTKLYPESRSTAISTPPHVLAPTVANIASLQSIEICKYALGIDSMLMRNWISTDLLNSDFQLIPS